jgi:UDP-N-acetylmuramoylalanine--D-glutamate ligase
MSALAKIFSFFILYSMNERNIKLTKEWFKGKKVTIMGLGLNGGNLAACLFLSDLGAELTVTDLRTPEILKPSMDRLTGFSINYVLGEHKIDDFTKAHLIIKNPAVPLDSPYLKAAQNAAVPIETDISLFLQFSESPILAVTGVRGNPPWSPPCTISFQDLFLPAG